MLLDRSVRIWISILLLVGGNSLYIVDQVNFSINHATPILTTNQQAPAKVTLRFSISKFTPELIEPFKFRLCIDKNHEKCFWTMNEDVALNDDSSKEVAYKFFINNMETNLSISIKVQSEETSIHFSRKNVNLKKINSKDTFEFHSLTLENSIKMTIEHECESNYYPINQCTKFCYPIPEEYSCDGFGNKICREGLYYDAKDEKCLPNNCVKSSIQCFNNGFCVNKGLTFECKCMESYIGKFCELPNPCFPDPCYKGKCFINQSTNSFFCSCPTGYSGMKCDTRKYKPCNCPPNMRCNYSESGILFSCTIEAPDDLAANPTRSPMDSLSQETDQKSVRLTEYKKLQNWANVSVTTTIIAAVGCLMIIISIAVSAYVCHRTRNHSSNTKNRPVANSPSTHYTQFSPKFSESTFKRSLSLDDNSAYIQGNQSLLTCTPPGLLTLGSSTGYSINSNSYQENPAVNFINYPTYSELCKQDTRTSFLILNGNCKEASNTDTVSSGSIPQPPSLPPRPSHSSESPVMSNVESN